MRHILLLFVLVGSIAHSQTTGCILTLQTLIDGKMALTCIPASGTKGDPGVAATVTVGSVTTGAPGAPAGVTNAGTPNAAVLNFSIPAGQPGQPGSAATITIGTVTTGEPGTQAAVTNSGTATAAKLDFTIPRGDAGTGSETPPAPTGPTGICPGLTVARTSVVVIQPDGNCTAIPVANIATSSTSGPFGRFASSFTGPVLSIGTDCTADRPCNVAFGSVVYSISGTATATLAGSGFGTAKASVMPGGIVRVSYDPTITVACSLGSECVAESQYPPGSVPLWTCSASAGSWIRCLDVRPAYSTALAQ